MYRLLISRKTVITMASIWLVSGFLLFIAGWLLGRHQGSPTVDAEQLADVLAHSTRARVQLASSSAGAAATTRDPRPWRT
ncbi:MAG: hypothetical protein AAFY88_15245, partial [Acidobacteriota bacterium]